MKKVFDSIANDKMIYKLPIEETLVRVRKTQFSQYRLSELEREWANCKQNASKHKKFGNITEEDKLVFDILNGSMKYRVDNGLYHIKSSEKTGLPKGKQSSNEK